MDIFMPTLLNFQGGLTMDPLYHRKHRVVFVMGATGTGKSRLAIDLAILFHGEIINSDKIQVYEGLPIVTNKVTEEECQGVPHHLLGIIDPQLDFTAIDFCHHALLALELITGRGRVPIIAGGSNSFIEALVNDPEFELKYECCFICVDVSMPVLHSFVSKRVDRMVECGLVQELKDFYNPEADNSKGIRRAIGVSEMDEYLKIETLADEETKGSFIETAIGKIKENTCKLVSRQLRKIRRLDVIWSRKMNHIDATELFLDQGRESWDRLVLRPSTRIVYKFLYHDDPMAAMLLTDAATGSLIVKAPVPVPMAAVAAATLFFFFLCQLLPPIKARRFA